MQSFTVVYNLSGLSVLAHKCLVYPSLVHCDLGTKPETYALTLIVAP